MAQQTILVDGKPPLTLKPGDTYSVRPMRPHLVTNDSQSSTMFLVLQGIGEYDYIPLA